MLSFVSSESSSSALTSMPGQHVPIPPNLGGPQKLTSRIVSPSHYAAIGHPAGLAAVVSNGGEKGGAAPTISNSSTTSSLDSYHIPATVPPNNQNSSGSDTLVVEGADDGKSSPIIHPVRKISDEMFKPASDDEFFSVNTSKAHLVKDGDTQTDSKRLEMDSAIERVTGVSKPTHSRHVSDPGKVVMSCRGDIDITQTHQENSSVNYVETFNHRGLEAAKAGNDLDDIDDDYSFGATFKTFKNLNDSPSPSSTFKTKAMKSGGFINGDRAESSADVVGDNNSKQSSRSDDQIGQSKSYDDIQQRAAALSSHSSTFKLKGRTAGPQRGALDEVIGSDMDMMRKKSNKS